MCGINHLLFYFYKPRLVCSFGFFPCKKTSRTCQPTKHANNASRKQIKVTLSIQLILALTSYKFGCFDKIFTIHPLITTAVQPCTCGKYGSACANTHFNWSNSWLSYSLSGIDHQFWYLQFFLYIHFNRHQFQPLIVIYSNQSTYMFWLSSLLIINFILDIMLIKTIRTFSKNSYSRENKEPLQYITMTSNK